MKRAATASQSQPVLENRPLYLQARDALMRQIAEGTLQPGDFLPSEQQLAATLGISVGTVRKATEELVAQGILDRQHGRGTQIVPHTSDRSRFRFFRFIHPDGRPARLTARLLTRKTQSPNRDEQHRLSLGRDDQVIVITRIRSENGMPLVFERICIPASRFERLSIEADRDMLEEIYVLYQKQCGEMVRTATDEIGYELAPGPVGKELKIAAGSPVLLVKRVAMSLANEPLEFRQSWTQSLRYLSRLE
ncbi:HTH-type transcriptional repressor yvoA OS=Afipia felis OX=1035 GN=yvoA PE=4 SV=1 [Afipia felis]